MSDPNAAFPMMGTHTVFQYGLTKREYFAAMSLAGIMEVVLLKRLETDENSREDETRAEWGARQAVAMADALMAALSKEKA